MSVWPQIIAASGEQRNETTAAISSGSTSRPAGVVDTEALDWFPNKEQMLASVKRTPAGRLVEPEDVAAVVSFLCSSDAAMICGQTLVVDGGYSLGA